MSWDTGKPIYDRLPGENELYRKDPKSPEYDSSKDVALWLTQFWDSFLIEQKENVENVYTDIFNPETARSENLDWLAQLAGYTGKYWDSDWKDEQKRLLIKRAFDFVWINKGTRSLLEWLIEIFRLDAQIYSPGGFVLGETPLGGVLGGEAFYYLIYVDFFRANYLRSSKEWKLLEKLNYLFGAASSESKVAYSRFILGFSYLGDTL